MEFVLYSLKTDPAIRISIDYEVDRYFWIQKAIIPQWCTSTRSMGQALALVQTRRVIETTSREGRVLTDPEWKYIEEQAVRVYPFLNGRSFLWAEVTALLQKRNILYTDAQLASIIQYLYLHNRVRLVQGVALEKVVSMWKCNRCFSSSSSIRKIECATCGEACAMCEQCLLLGRSRACSVLLQFYEEKERESRAIPAPELMLTTAQLKISKGVNAFLDSSKKQALVWAVTGAGKTEMLVPSVWKVLSQGRRVLWVTPRKDVVIEIAPRLREFFPTVRSVALYGGSDDAWGDGDLVVSTAHQAWRYYYAFDLVIVDEVDAFPLYGNESLEKGIARALLPEAKYIYLTATPPVKWKRHMAGTSSLFVLPVRYHEHPLPIPHIAGEWFLDRRLAKSLPIPTVFDFLQKVDEKEGQAFIFVPRTKDVQKVVDWLLKHGVKEELVTGVYSQDPRRKEKVLQFREGKLKILVTTTILERGVTVRRGFVLVWGADHPVFDKASLIQIAGRVGRSGDYQQGEVWFLSRERTESQQQAKKEIEWLNQQAKKEGFLKKAAYYP